MTTPLNPLICGLWNAHSLWMQWTPAEDAVDGYKVEIRITPQSLMKLAERPFRQARLSGVARAPKSALPTVTVVKPEWKVVDTGRTKGYWLAIPIWQTGAKVEARVSVNGRAADPETAMECEFARSLCVFNFQAGSVPLMYPTGASFHAYVDASACSYVTDTEIHVLPDETLQATVRALASSGFCQLDHEAHFDIHPAPGVRIWNAWPSTNDVKETGRDFTELEIRQRDGPFSMVVVEQVNPNIR